MTMSQDRDSAIATILVTWPEHLSLIGPDWSRDLNTGLWLVVLFQFSHPHSSDWQWDSFDEHALSGEVPQGNQYWPLIGRHLTEFWRLIGQATQQMEEKLNKFIQDNEKLDDLGVST